MKKKNSSNCQTSEKEFVSFHIRKLRENLGYSQEYVAIQAGISQPHLSKIEQGDHSPTLEILRRLIAVLSYGPREEWGHWLEIISRYPTSKLNHQELRGLTFDQAKDGVKRYMREGEFFCARKYIFAMERLATTQSEMGKAILALACYAKDLDLSEWAFQLFRQVPDKLKDEDKDSVIWSMYFCNFADLYCNLNEPVMAEVLVKEVLARNPVDNLYHCWALFLLGRISLLAANVQEGINFFREAIKKLEKLERKFPNHSGWFRFHLAKALLMRYKRDKEGLAILRQLVERWGPHEPKPENAEIYAWSALEYGLAAGEDLWLERAERVAKRVGLSHILRLIEKRRTDSEKAGILIPRLAGIVAFAIGWLICFFILSSVGTWAASVLDDLLQVSLK